MKEKPKVILVGLFDTQKDMQPQEASLKEAEFLVDTYGGEIYKVITQNISHHSAATYIGQGKAEELAKLVIENNIPIVVVNGNLKSSQLFTLKKIFGTDLCEVWDRTLLILQIFKKHAHTSESKLQIHLAELNHKGPELSGLGVTMSQQGGGIGTRGIGETNTEILKRHWEKEIQNVKEKLNKVSQNREQQMKHRKKTGTPTVSIVGYTNAGKTTLFNTISNKNDKVQNALFATLDSSVSSMYLKNLGKEIYVSDTIGFIQDLPTTLIDAFKSTLMETLNADILLHVIDSSDKNISLKIATVNKIIRNIQLAEKKQLYVFNKTDRLSVSKQKKLAQEYSDKDCIFISAKQGIGITELLELIEKELLAIGIKRAKYLDYLGSEI